MPALGGFFGFGLVFIADKKEQGFTISEIGQEQEGT